MKKNIFVSLIFILSIFIFQSCNESFENSITFQNNAAEGIIVNFRASAISISSGQSKVITEIPKGTYDYQTTFTVPSNATGSTFTGAVSGSVSIKAGTRILIIYSSTLINGLYTLSATISNSDDSSQNNNPTAP